jgi:hypothetical protein
MENNPHDLDDPQDEENGLFFLSSDGDSDDDEPAMYGIRAPRCGATREWRFDSLRISHIMDMHEMLQILEDIMSYMLSLLPYTLGLVAYLRRTGAAIQGKILSVIEAMAWLMCYAEMLIVRSMLRRMDPTYTEKEVQSILNALDLDERGSVQFEEFKRIFNLDKPD